MGGRDCLQYTTSDPPNEKFSVVRFPVPKKSPGDLLESLDFSTKKGYNGGKPPAHF
jgi:hypothetical protein